MNTNTSLRTRVLAFAMCVVMVLGMLPEQVAAQSVTGAVAKIGETEYNTLEDALNAVPTGSNKVLLAEATTITLLQDTTYAFDVGTATGSTTMNLVLDLNEKTLTLAPGKGSAGTESNGIRVLAYSQLEIKNGTVVCSSEVADNVKVGIANYGSLTLSDVELKKGDQTIYTVNNRGDLTLNGKTIIDSNDTGFAITNDPYNLYYTTDKNASVTCNSSEVFVESMQMERYLRTSDNNGGVELNISAGYFGKIVEDGKTDVATSYSVTGGTIGVSTTEELELALSMVEAGAAYACPEKAVTIKLLNDMDGSFDVGTSTGKAPKNIVLDLNEKTMTLKPGVGSYNTKSNGIRVLAYSKLEIKNGTLKCSDEEADNVKVGIANYSELVLDGVDVQSGDQTIYTINNRGNLTLKGETVVEDGKVAQPDYEDSAEFVAITNDPYNLYYNDPINAEVNCEDSNVTVGNIQLETYGSKGDIELNISAGSFGVVSKPDAAGTVAVKGAISGGTFKSDVSDYCAENYETVKDPEGNFVPKYFKDQTITTNENVELTWQEDPIDDLDETFLLSGAMGEGAVEYVIDETYNAVAEIKEGKLYLYKVDTFVIEITKKGDNTYSDSNTVTVTVTVNPANQTITTDETVELTWQADSIDPSVKFAVNGAQGEGAVEYVIDETYKAIAEIKEGKLYLYKAGTFEIKITKKGDDTYSDSNTVTVTVTVNRANQSDLAFSENQYTVKFNENNNIFKQLATQNGATSSKDIAYYLLDGTDLVTETAVAKINRTSGEVEIKKVGQVKVVAIRAADEQYEEARAEYTLVINKAPTQDISFADNAEIEYGTLEWIASVKNNVIKGNDCGTGAITWSIVEATNKIGATMIDAETGKITFSDTNNVDKIGTITIKATIAADDNYEEDSATFTLTVKYPENVPDPIISGTEGKNDWYTTDIEIKAPDGYLISESNSLSGEWDEPVTRTDGTHTVTVYLKNTSTGAISDAIEVSVKVDTKVPENLDISYSSNVNLEKKDGYAIADFGNFPKEKVVVTFSATDATSGIASVAYNKDGGVTYIPVTAENGVYSITVEPGYLGKIKLRVTDWAGNVDEIEADEILVVDNVEPEISTKIEDAKVDAGGVIHTNINNQKITFTITDANFNLETAYPTVKVNDEEVDKKNLNWTVDENDKNKATAVLNLPDEGTYEVTASFTDLSGNPADVFSAVICVDRTAPDVEVTYDDGKLSNTVEGDGTTITRQDVVEADRDENSRFVFSAATAINVKITETNFFAADVVVKVNGEPYAVTWTSDGAEHIAVIKLEKDGDYVVEVSYIDRAENEMKWTSAEFSGKEGTKTFTSNIFTVDTTDPVVSADLGNVTPSNGKYYDKNLTATITVTDRNFRPNEINLVIDAVNAAGEKVTLDAVDLTKWTGVWTNKGNGTWVTTVDFKVDANYDVQLNYADIAGNSAAEQKLVFVVDKAAPQDLDIIYVYEKDNKNLFEEILDALTFGVLYYNDTTEVKLTAKDLTGGFKQFVLYTKQSGTKGATTIKLPEKLTIAADGTVTGNTGDIKNIKVTNENGVMTVTFKVPGEFRGEFSFDAVDLAERVTSKNDSNIVVVDTIAPDRTVTFRPIRVVDAATMLDVEAVAEGDKVVLYYNTEAVATIVVEEANFFAEDVVIQVNGKDFAPAKWTNTEGDVWTTTVTLKDEGDYVITMSYKDRSTNKMVDYTSQRIVIDKTAPVINVQYSNTDVKNTIDGRDYFDATQKATIAIKEHNFRADEVVILVTAKDVLGKDVLKLNADGTVASYATLGVARDSWSSYAEGTWRREDDTYVLELTYDADANYTFDVAYTDLATNKAKDYDADAFTVDKTAPKNLTVTYSTSVLEQILESITFGYYNSQMTVTITAEDDTTGILHFAYSYINGQNVSSVNAQLLDQAIQAAEITYDGIKATASFTIPKLVLGNDNQFNGTVEFVAYDRSENDTLLKDNTQIVVDNISPVATITYNKPVKEANGVAYYDGNISASIEIREANFHAGDVKVVVTKDGKDLPVNVTWVDNNVDVHTGTFTLTADGDYTVSVKYTDKSGNDMADYLSGKMTLDTEAPVIELSDVVNNSANKDETYGFTITIRDTNLDAAAMKPVLTAVVKGEDGKYKVETIDLGKAVAVTEGKEYTYTVKNLTADALYTLVCTAADMSKNDINKLLLEDGKSYETVQFSVNREGSVFGYGNSFAEKLVEQYFVYSVDEDIVIVEVNVDPIEDYKVTLNGKELVEGTDYTTVQTSKDGEWSMRTYTISKALFAAEGEYNVIVSSVDKAGSTAYSDVKSLSVGFVVDQSKPAVTITGMTSGGRYQTNEQIVTLIPTDEGGRLNSLKVVLLDARGNPLTDENGTDISVRFDMSGEELLKHLEANDGKVTFTIPEGLNSQVKITCDDCVTGATELGNAYVETFDRVTVSQNQLVIFYANTPLFIGTIVGVLALIALIIFLIKRKKDKKNKA